MPNVIGMTWRQAVTTIETATDGMAQVEEDNVDDQGIVISSDPPAGYCLDNALANATIDIAMTLTT
jgi:beta-lactam-binding protein with PASTA domain